MSEGQGVLGDREGQSLVVLRLCVSVAKPLDEPDLLQMNDGLGVLDGSEDQMQWFCASRCP